MCTVLYFFVGLYTLTRGWEPWAREGECKQVQVGSSQIRWVIYLILAISLSAFVEDVTILVRGPPPHGEPRVQAMGTVSLWVKSRQQLPGVLHAVMAGGGATWATGGAVRSHLACGGGMAISAVAAMAGQRRPVSGDARCGGRRGRLWCGGTPLVRELGLHP